MFLWYNASGAQRGNMQDIKGLNLEELERFLQSHSQARFRARQVLSWIYKKAAEDFSAMSDLSLALRKLLGENFYVCSLNLVKRLKSKDKTEKFLFGLKDGNLIEAVAIPTDKRLTVCVSTQVGCKFACNFCASGKSGFRRNLSCAEIVEQALFIKDKNAGKKITNLVLMGIGEPLDNYDNAVKAIRIINSPAGLNIGARKITVSTCGIIPGINRLSKEGLQIELSVSLHAADDKLRSRLMPVNKIYPLKDLIASCADYIKKTNRQITLEYVMIEGVNSDLSNAGKLSKICKSLKLCKVNLIPSSRVHNIAPPGKSELRLFREYLLKQGVNATLRRPRGEDIEAACGQLRLIYEKR